MSSADDAMSQYAEGDTTAFDVVYDTVAPRLETYLRRHVRNRALREDIMQQTFLQMHSARGTFIVGAAVLPWAFAIARRLMIDSGRKTHRESHCLLNEDAVPGTVDLPPSHIDPRTPLHLHLHSGEALLEAQEAGVRLSTAYAHLSEPQRAAYDLVKVEGLSHAQAALALGTTVTGIKLRVHRAYLMLRKALVDSPPPAEARPVPGWKTAEGSGPVKLMPLDESR